MRVWTGNSTVYMSVREVKCEWDLSQCVQQFRRATVTLFRRVKV